MCNVSNQFDVSGSCQLKIIELDGFLNSDFPNWHSCYDEVAARLGLPVTQVSVLRGWNFGNLLKGSLLWFLQSFGREFEFWEEFWCVSSPSSCQDTAFTSRTFDHQNTLRPCIGQHLGQYKIKVYLSKRSGFIRGHFKPLWGLIGAPWPFYVI